MDSSLPPALWRQACEAAQHQMRRLSGAMAQAQAAWDQQAYRLVNAATAQMPRVSQALPPGIRTASPPFASASLAAAGVPADGSKRKPRGFTPEEREAALAAMQAMSPEEREALAQAAWVQLLKSRRVSVDGQKKDLYTLMQEVQEEEELQAAEEYKLRDTPAFLRKKDVRSDEIRLGATKRMLFPEEEEELGLSRMGIGIKWADGILPWLAQLVGKRDFVYGIYADPDATRKVVGPLWKGENPAAVLADDAYYRTLLATAPATGMTLMAIPTRDLPLDDMRAALTAHLRSRMAALPDGLTAEDEEALAELADCFTSSKLGSSGLLTDTGRLRQRSTFMFTAGTKGQLAVEAITAGTLREQARVYMGMYPNERLTWALFDCVLGDKPLDPAAKLAVGNNMLFAANGFKFPRTRSPDNPYQVEASDPDQPFPQPDVKEITVHPGIFAYAADGTKPILRGTRTARVKAHPLRDV